MIFASTCGTTDTNGTNKMSVLNLRNVPEDLMRNLRSEAALAGYKHLHAFCVALLEDGLLRRRISQNSYPLSDKCLSSATIYPTIEATVPETRADLTGLAKTTSASFRQEIEASQVRRVVDAAFDQGESLAPAEPKTLEIEIT